MRVKDDDSEADVIVRLAERLVKHVLPALQLGFGRTDVGHNYYILMHFLELLAPSMAKLPELVRCLFTLTSDYGVESAVPRVLHLTVGEVFPYMRANDYIGDGEEHPRGSAASNRDEDDFAVPPADQDPDFAPDLPHRRHLQAKLDLTTVEVSGLLHIISNAGKDLVKVMDGYRDATDRLQKVSNMLRVKETKERLQETCFGLSPVGQAMFDRSIRRFHGECYPERWGTVAHCVLQMTAELKAALDFGWDAKKYMFGKGLKEPKEPDSSDEGADHQARIDLVDEVLSGEYWWQYWFMLSRVAKVLHAALVWAEGCACHDRVRLELSQLAEEERRQWHKEMKACADSCPLRGRRCAELAAGDFHEVISDMYKQEAASLYLDLPTTLPDEQRLAIVSEFEKSRQHLLSTFILKLAHWRECPYTVFGVAHYQAAKAMRCYRFAMASNCTHELMMELKGSELEEERELFETCEGILSDKNFHDAPRFRAFLAKLRLAPSAERRAEGLHAVVNRTVKRCPNHSDALVSQANRYPAVRSWVTESRSNLARFSTTLKLVPDGRAACNALGFGSHPASVAAKNNSRDIVHYQVIYHSDAMSKYKLAAPKVVLYKSDVKPTPGKHLVHYM